MHRLQQGLKFKKCYAPTTLYQVEKISDGTLDGKSWAYEGTLEGIFLDASVGRLLGLSECFADVILLGASVRRALDTSEGTTNGTLFGASVGRLFGTLEGTAKGTSYDASVRRPSSTSKGVVCGTPLGASTTHQLGIRWAHPKAWQTKHL